MINKERYKKIVKEGERVDWYGDMVPKELITEKVKLMVQMVVKNIDILESTLADVRGSSREKRKSYIDRLWTNIKEAPYRMNGDFYLKIKKEIESDEKSVEKKVKTTRRKVNKKTTTNTIKSSKTGPKTKNSGLIFGKNKK
jgi:hypothetical protein